MEVSAPAVVNRRWLLCILVSFLGLILLSSSGLNQGWLPGSVIGSLRRNPAPAAVSWFPGSSEDRMQLSPQASVEERPMPSPSPSPSPPYKLVTSPPLPSLEKREAGISPQPSASQVTPTSQAGVEPSAAPPAKCDLYDGKWVYDPRAYPLYKARRCPFLSDQVSCRRNGRPDSGYEHWRWEARGCEIPRFNGSYMLEKLRGKRVVIVGDSLNRNQWESLACLLYSSARRSRTFVKLREDYKIFRALDYNCTVEFFWSPFLVPLEGGENQPKVLKLKRLPGTSKRWVGADVMVFNTGHWWTHRGSLKKWKYLELGGGQLVEEMGEDMAFETAMKTWARWIDRWVDPARTAVFFRSIAPEHKKESNHWCYNQTHPLTGDDQSYTQWFPRSMRSIVERTIRRMRTPVEYLNITRLSEYRRDAHTGVYTTRRGKLLTPAERRDAETYADCSHWCLPGLPDTWNALIYASIVGTPSIVS